MRRISPKWFVPSMRTCCSWNANLWISGVRVIEYRRLMRQGLTTNPWSWQVNIYYIKIALYYATLGRAFRKCFYFQNVFLCIHKYDDHENHMFVKTIYSWINIQNDWYCKYFTYILRFYHIVCTFTFPHIKLLHDYQLYSPSHDLYAQIIKLWFI